MCAVRVCYSACILYVHWAVISGCDLYMHGIVEVLWSGMCLVLFQEQKGDVSEYDEAADQEDAVPSTSKPSAKETRSRQTGGYITCISSVFYFFFFFVTDLKVWTVLKKNKNK